MRPKLHEWDRAGSSRKKIIPSTRKANQTGAEINVNPEYSLQGFAITVKRYG
jgi:hypothetical protein